MEELISNRIFSAGDNIYFYPEKKLLFTTKEKVSTEKMIEDFSGFESLYKVCPNTAGFETDLTVLLTTGCNLRCVYCYSKAGDIPIKKVPREAVIRNINKVIKNSVLLSQANPQRVVKATIKFTGGGEPTFAWNELVEYVEYIYAIGLKEKKYFDLTIQTNGQVGDKEKIEYICNKFDEVIISCDGYGDMQNNNRPRADGGDSWEYLSEFISILDNRKVNYALRTTVTNSNIDQLYDMCDYFFKKYPNLGFVHFEPLGHGGRGENMNMIDMNKFAETLLKLNKQYLGKVGTSTAPYRLKNGCYCDSQTGYSVVLNTDGDIVSCVEMANTNDENCSWTIQKYVDSEYVKNENYQVKSRTGEACKNCYALPFCFGGCPLRIIRDSSGKIITEYGKNFCGLEHKVVKAFMKGALNNCESVSGAIPSYVDKCVLFPPKSNIR